MSNQQLFSPYRGINLQHLSDASVCYPGNPISACVNFTPRIAASDSIADSDEGSANPADDLIFDYHQMGDFMEMV